MIELNQINYHYDNFKMHFNLKIAAKEKVVIIGRSGAGKSTLLNLIAGFVSPNSGQILLNHQNMTRTLPGKRPVSILFQRNNLFNHLTVEQNIGLGIKPCLKLNASERQTIEDMLVKVSLAGFNNRYPNQLSGGQRQRVALARCLIQHRPVLLLDEPFSALDQALRFEMLALVDQICDDFNLTLMMVSHYLDDSLNYFSRCLVVDNGNIVFNDLPTQLAQSKHNEIAKMLGFNYS
ncbi:thiamine ABC transporter, ATP-binding protein [Gilliamella sp. Fer1-1]|jgi:thiamine transport system ATP-binding protein|uniref:thiamine ABC transporter ATP-binding protein ThiQ n=1 Tax=unclassified Gilliamella TaxID=2685620 RepID=UPI00080EC1D8|nr:thiamine ABC transporter ATP-binding protein ThiQ [Gilliamella apicola]OCG23227.1 thiamine ABC transporter, ATP-binding protein [Gilliamella apicola]OCG31599.1 thiamine ABC transporter, ATP-binding protein [Gilliamella apicola]OCG32399.1 thiamine ABC transporter, ATP-binding protein [Gilliamella apicola]OCG43720.1 thiamine ABC transporter, ATP-binding protein [Gilliamella apicola]